MSEVGLDEWLALRRVHDGGVAKLAGVYFDHGRPAPEHLTGVFDRLVWSGLVGVAAGDPLWALRRLSLTDAGALRYAALGERRDTPQAPPPEHAITQTSPGAAGPPW